MGKHYLNDDKADPMFPPFRGDLNEDAKTEVEKTESNSWFGADQQG